MTFDENPPQKQTRSKRLTAAVAMGALLVAAAAPALVRNWQAENDTADFAPVYAAAKAMWSGQDIYAATNGFYIYSPLVAFVFQPLTTVPEHAAAIIWVLISGSIFFYAAFLAAKEITNRWRPTGQEIDVALPWTIAAIALLLSFDKIHADFSLGQTDCIMIIGFACVLRWMKRRPLLAGFAVGFSANFKYLSLIFVPYFIVKRNYRAAIASIVFFFFLMGLPALEIGFSGAEANALTAFRGTAKLIGLRFAVLGPRIRIPPATWDRSISLTSAIFRATRSYGSSELVRALPVLFFACLILGLIIWGARREGVCLFKPQTAQPEETAGAIATLEWATLTVFAIIFAPQIMARHMILTMLVYMLAIQIFLASHRKSARTLLAVAIFVTALGLSVPLRGAGLEHLLWNWRRIAGASWCALILILVVVWAGSQTILDIRSLDNPRA